MARMMGPPGEELAFEGDRPNSRKPAPKAAPKKAARKAAPGPMQPAFGAGFYMQKSPWSAVQIDPEFQARVPDLVPPKPVPPVQFKDTAISQDILEGPSPYTADFSNSLDNKLAPVLGNQMLRRPYLGPGVGKSVESGLQAQQREGMNVKEDRYMPRGQYAGLASEIEELPQFQERRRSVANYEKAGRDIANNIPTDIDISPLLALSDTWFGGNLSKGYKAPLGYMDKAKAVFEQANQAQDLQGQYLQDLLKSTQYLKSGSQENEALRTLAETMGYANKNEQPKNYSRGGGQNRGSAIDDYKIIQEGAKISKEALDKLSSLDSAEQLLAAGDLGSIRRSLSIVARAVSGEKGVLTEQDITRVLPATINMDVNKFQAYLTSNPGVLADPKVINALIRDVRSARGRITKNADDKLSNFGNSLKQSPNFANKPIDQMLLPYKESLSSKQQSAIKSPDEIETNEFRQQFKQLLEQNKKGGK